MESICGTVSSTDLPGDLVGKAHSRSKPAKRFIPGSGGPDQTVTSTAPARRAFSGASS